MDAAFASLCLQRAVHQLGALGTTAKGMTVGSTVVVTGAAGPVAEVAEALKHAGAEVIAVDDLSLLDATFAGIAPGSLDGYVQLPVHVAARGDTVVERVHNFLEDGLLARFAAASKILPAISDVGRVVLVGGHTLVEAAAPDDQSARLALLGVLADAIQADKSSAPFDVRVLHHAEPAKYIGAVALGTEPSREQTLAEMLEREPPMSFDDWRIEVMGLVNGEF